MYSFIAVLFFGLLGLSSRFAIDHYFMKWNSHYPLTTLIINLLGSFLAGLIYSLSTSSKEISSILQMGLLVGFCGGFTTFSAYSLQTLQMLERGKITVALAYLFLSPVLGLLMAFLPVYFMKRL